MQPFNFDLDYKLHYVGGPAREREILQEVRVQNIRDGQDARFFNGLEVRNTTSPIGSRSWVYLYLMINKPEVGEGLARKLEMNDNFHRRLVMLSYSPMDEKIFVHRATGRNANLAITEEEQLGIERQEFSDKENGVRVRLAVSGLEAEVYLSRNLIPNWWQFIFDNRESPNIRPITNTRIRISRRECVG